MADYRKYLNPDVLTKIARLELRARMIVEGFISGMHKSPYQGFSVEFAAHREYVPGDDIRHIDWRLFGRADRFYIKQYEEETNLRTQLLLDCSRSMAYPEHPGRARMTKYDYACTLAASLVYLLMHQQDACGLVMFDRDVRERIPPTSSTAQLRSIIEVIERNAPDDTTDVKMLFTKMAEQFKQRGLVVLISDLLTDVDEVIEGLQRLRYTRHDVIVFHILDHDEVEFPFEDNTQFEGLEAPEVNIFTDPQNLRESYLEIVHEFIRKVRTTCMNHRIDYKLLTTRDPLDAGLATFLATRMHQVARR